MRIAFRTDGDFDAFFGEDSEAWKVHVGNPYHALKRQLEGASYTLISPARTDDDTVAYVTYTPDVQKLRMLRNYPNCKAIYLQFEPEPVYGSIRARICHCLKGALIIY